MVTSLVATDFKVKLQVTNLVNGFLQYNVDAIHEHPVLLSEKYYL